jgi:hypothetical protein
MTRKSNGMADAMESTIVTDSTAMVTTAAGKVVTLAMTTHATAATGEILMVDSNAVLTGTAGVTTTDRSSERNSETFATPEKTFKKLGGTCAVITRSYREIARNCAGISAMAPAGKRSSGAGKRSVRAGGKSPKKKGTFVKPKLSCKALAASSKTLSTTDKQLYALTAWLLRYNNSQAFFCSEPFDPTKV